MATQKLSRSKELAIRVVFAALQILREKGGEAPGRDVVAAVEQRVALNDWATATYAKSGYVRWQSILHFYSIDCIKAGYLVKKKGVWYLTAEGEAARKLGDVGLLNAATAAYRRWRDENQPIETKEDHEVSEEGQQGHEATIHEIEQVAIEGLKNGSVSKVEIATPMGLIYKVLFPSISTFETSPSIQGERIQTIQRSSCVASEVKDSRW